MASSSPVAVVVGGSGGIGSAICRRLAADGYRVVVGYVSGQKRADALVAELGTDHLALQIIATDSDSLEAARSKVEDEFGRVDVLVNCAGVTRPVAHDDLDSLDDELIDRIFSVNWRGPFAAIRSFRSLLETTNDPVVVNISSIAAIRYTGVPYASYYATKAALNQLTRATAVQYAPDNVRVNAILPGLMRTPMVEMSTGLAGEYGDGDVDRMWRVRDAQVPMGHMGEA